MINPRFKNASEYTYALAQAVAEIKGLKVDALSGVSCSAYIGGVRFSDHADFVKRGERETIRIDGTFTEVYAVMDFDENGDTISREISTDDIEDLSREEREGVEYVGIEVDRATFDRLVAEGVSIA